MRSRLDPPSPPPTDVAGYYANPDVRAALLEYCGGPSGTAPTAAFLTGLCPDSLGAPTWSTAAQQVDVSHVDALWRRGCDISRSLWDREHLVFLFELDYENIDQPAEPFLRPTEVFFKLEPAVAATRRVFAEYGLHARAVMTGRGYQFTGQVSLADPLVSRLASLVPQVPAWHPLVEARRPPGVPARMTAEHARASTALGLIIEHVAHLVMTEASGHSRLPIVFNGTVVGTGLIGRECVSIDFSHAGDPLDVRHFRAAFSTYQYHRLRPDIFGTQASTAVPPLVALPRDGQPLTRLLAHGRGLDAGIKAARKSSTFLPGVARGLNRLVDAYDTSRLAGFHRQYFAELGVAGRNRVVALDDLPPCIAAPLRWPNDLLLKPEHVQHVVRGLMAREWSPAEIAHVVRARYEADYGWGDRWSHMHPSTRAEFDVRVFAGLIYTGLDSLVDYNCVSAKEKEVCPRAPGCAFDLRSDHRRLKERQVP